jgi:hypothetical protein
MERSELDHAKYDLLVARSEVLHMQASIRKASVMLKDELRGDGEDIPTLTFLNRLHEHPQTARAEDRFYDMSAVKALLYTFPMDDLYWRTLNAQNAFDDLCKVEIRRREQCGE